MIALPSNGHVVRQPVIRRVDDPRRPAEIVDVPGEEHLVVRRSDIVDEPRIGVVAAPELDRGVANPFRISDRAIEVVRGKAGGQVRVEQIQHVFERLGRRDIDGEVAEVELVFIANRDVDAACLLAVDVDVAVVDQDDVERLVRHVARIAYKQIAERVREYGWSVASAEDGGRSKLRHLVVDADVEIVDCKA